MTDTPSTPRVSRQRPAVRLVSLRPLDKSAVDVLRLTGDLPSVDDVSVPPLEFQRAKRPLPEPRPSRVLAYMAFNGEEVIVQEALRAARKGHRVLILGHVGATGLVTASAAGVQVIERDHVRVLHTILTTGHVDTHTTEAPAKLETAGPVGDSLTPAQEAVMRALLSHPGAKLRDTARNLGITEGTLKVHLRAVRSAWGLTGSSRDALMTAARRVLEPGEHAH